MPGRVGTAVIPSPEGCLRDRVDHAYAEARRLVFDVVQLPVDEATLIPGQAAALHEFHEAESALNALRAAHRAEIEAGINRSSSRVPLFGDAPETSEEVPLLDVDSSLAGQQVVTVLHGASRNAAHPAA